MNVRARNPWEPYYPNLHRLLMRLLSKIQQKTLSDMEFFAKIGIPDYSMERWEYLVRFLRRAWFRRTWILQEVAFAEDLTILCGPQEISWDELLKVVTVLSTNIGIFRLKARVEIARIHIFKEAFALIKLFRDRYQTGSMSFRVYRALHIGNSCYRSTR